MALKFIYIPLKVSTLLKLIIQANIFLQVIPKIGQTFYSILINKNEFSLIFNKKFIFPFKTFYKYEVIIWQIYYHKK